MNQTREDAQNRLNRAAIGSLGENPSLEYITNLEQYVSEWLEGIKERRITIEKNAACRSERNRELGFDKPEHHA